MNRRPYRDRFPGLSSNSIERYRSFPHLVEAMCQSLAATNINAE
jgi:hypothetical protein